MSCLECLVQISILTNSYLEANYTIRKVAKLTNRDFLVLKAFGCNVCLPKPSRVFMVSWTCSLEGVYKLNIDGKCFGNPGSSSGRVLFGMDRESLWVETILSIV